MSRVLVTGIGAISSIGQNVEENFSSLCAGKHGLHGKAISYSNLKHLPTGEVPFSNPELAKKAGVDFISQTWSRTDLLGIIAAREAIESAGLSDTDLSKSALISATTVGGMDVYEQYHEALRKDAPPPTNLIAYDCADSTEKIADEFGIKAFVTSISTACSSSANAIMLGARLIKAGKVDRALVGGTEALARFTINGFNSLKILDDQLCQPFDQARRGLNLGEGAAFLIIESEAAAKRRGAQPLAELLGYSNRNDAYHQTASSPEGSGAFSAMQETLQMADVQPSEVDLINAHGTGTGNNDLSESIAIKRLFGDKIPPFSSTKSFTGHTLATAGSIQAVYSILTLNRGKAFANLRFETAIEDTGLIPLQHTTDGEFKKILSNSFGFGGNSSSLLFGRA